MTHSVKLPISFENGRNPAVRKETYIRQPSSSPVLWITLIGIFLPQFVFSAGGLNLTPGRLVVIFLLVPAIRELLKSGRRGIASDFFAVALSIWMLLSSALNGGFRPYVGR